MSRPYRAGMLLPNNAETNVVPMHYQLHVDVCDWVYAVDVV